MPGTKKCEISIFMPVYNGSKYLNKSIESIIGQTYKNWNLLCVDDFSTDNSISILNKFAEKDQRIKVYKKETPGDSVPQSFNYILPKLSSAENIFYMSQDDSLSCDCLEQMIKRQKETDADCILPDMVYYYGESSKRNKEVIGINGNREKILTNKEAIVLSLNWQIHGFALIKSKIFANEHFPEDSYDSGEYMTRKFFLKSNKTAFSKGIFYYRQNNPEAITKSFSVKNYYRLKTLLKILKLLKDNNFDESVITSRAYHFAWSFKDYYKKFKRQEGIKSDTEYKKTKKLFKELFPEIDIKSIYKYASRQKGIKKIKTYALGLSYLNPILFRASIFFF